MRIALHTGKGGVGKTTISAATALACAGRACGCARPQRADPAGVHRPRPFRWRRAGPAGRRGSVARQRVSPTLGGADRRPRPVRGTAGRRSADYLVGVLAARGMAEVQAEELTVLPGAEEIVALLELRRFAASGEFDVIVVDCAPTGETLRLLALPETIGFYAQRLMGAPQRVLRSLAASLTGLPGAVPNAAVRDALGELLTS